MDAADRHHGDAGHGDDQLAVLLDALDVALGAFVDAVDHAHAVAGVVFRRVGAEILHVAARVGRGHEDERAHLAVGHRARLAAARLRVVHEHVIVFALELLQPRSLAADEHQRGDQLRLDVAELPLVIRLDGVQRDIALQALGKEGFEIDHAVVKHLEGVPVETFRGWLDDSWRHKKDISSTP